jgi:hypothetical protein
MSFRNATRKLQLNPKTKARERLSCKYPLPPLRSKTASALQLLGAGSDRTRGSESGRVKGKAASGRRGWSHLDLTREARTAACIGWAGESACNCDMLFGQRRRRIGEGGSN